MLHGIDISRYQKDIDLAVVQADFVIIKASEGIGYKDKCFDRHLSQIQINGKRFGFYHFARPRNDAIKEAEWFFSVVKEIYKGGILVLDWEAENQWDTAWCKRWLDKVYELTGVKPLIYMSEAVVRAHNWSAVAVDYPLWVAKYRDNSPDYNYDMSRAGTEPKLKYWEKADMWQWTSTGRLNGYSGNLDCNIFYGDEAEWINLTGIKTQDKKEEEPKMSGILKDGYQEINWIGQKLLVYKQNEKEKIALISGDHVGQRRLLNTYKIPGKKIKCLTNASYFIDNSKSPENGQVLGREQSLTRDAKPDQSALLDAVFKNDLEIVFRDIASWEYPKAEVIFGLSPAVCLLYNGAEMTAVSPAVGTVKYTKPYPQTLLMQDKDNRFVLAITRGKLTGKQCRDFAKAYGMKNCFMLDSGGSSQMVVDGVWKARTGRTLPNALAFYEDLDTATPGYEVPGTAKGTSIIEETPTTNIEVKPIGKVHVHRIGLNIRSSLNFNRKKTIASIVGFVNANESIELVNFVPGLQNDGFQWVIVKHGKGIAYCQYDSNCYSIEIYK